MRVRLAIAVLSAVPAFLSTPAASEPCKLTPRACAAVSAEFAKAFRAADEALDFEHTAPSQAAALRLVAAETSYILAHKGSIHHDVFAEMSRMVVCQHDREIGKREALCELSALPVFPTVKLAH